MVTINLQLTAHEMTCFREKIRMVQDENYKAVLARKMLKKDTVFKEF